MNIHNYNHLYYFYITAKLESFTAAALFLNTSQPSLSSQIKTLESVLQKKLFKKIGRKIQLTEEGKNLYHYCHKGFSIFEEMFEVSKNTTLFAGTKISIGVTNEVDRLFITDLLAEISEKYDIKSKPLVKLISLSNSELFQQLHLSEIDVILTTKALITEDIQILKEFELPIGVYCGNEIYKQTKNFNLDKILKIPEITFSLPAVQTGLRSEINNFFLKRKIQPYILFESNIMASVIRATVDGLGITLLPSVYLKHEISTGKIYSLSTKPLWNHRLIMLSIKNQLNENKLKFINQLSSEMQLLLMS